MDLNRRTFLKSMGLGGIILTMPKPLEIIAAQMSDIEDPPIQAGFASVKMREPFSLHRLTWMANSRKPLDAMLGIHLDHPELGRVENVLHSKILPNPTIYDCMYECMSVINIPEGTTVEFWVVCPERTKTPPKVNLQLLGTVGRVEDGQMRGRMYIHTLLTDHVRLDRTKAIKLGLIDPREEKLIIH